MQQIVLAKTSWCINFVHMRLLCKYVSRLKLMIDKLALQQSVVVGQGHAGFGKI